jgi:hypothetical protein
MSDFEITLEQAKNWIKTWRNNLPKEPAKAHLINKQALLDVMQPVDVVSVRTYLAIDDEGVQKLVLVGVDANGKDLIDETHIITDRTSPCPPVCDVNNPLFTLK